MFGLMQDHPLLISNLIVYAARHHATQEIVSRRVEGDIHRYTYRDAELRSRQLAQALDAMGLAESDRVATLAWNGYRHLELYFGVSGSGRVVHTVNPRLPPDQLAWIVNDAEDRVFCFDMTFLPLVKAIAAKCPTVKYWVALCEADALPADSGIPRDAGVRRQRIGLAERDPILHRRALRGDGLHQRQEGHVEAEDAVLGIVDDPGELVGRQARIDGMHDTAAAADAEIELEMAVPVPGERRHAVGLGEAHRIERLRELA